MTFPSSSRFSRRIVWLLLISCICLPDLYGQSIWRAVREAAIPVSGDRRIVPTETAYFTVEPEQLLAILEAAPHEREGSAENSPTILALPLPGGPQSFRIVAYDLSGRSERETFSHIRTWYGVGVDQPDRTVYLDWTSRGFHASVRFGEGATVFVDPLFRGERTLYQVYRKEDFKVPHSFSCGSIRDGGPGVTPTAAGRTVTASGSDCTFREYEAAIAATGEYSRYHGANGPGHADLVHSAIVTVVNRVNQVYSREIGLRLKLVEHNADLYHYNPVNDPYSGGSPSALLTENTTVLNEVLGVGSYDLGHVFSAGFDSGVAYRSSSCGAFRGGGVTGSSAPEGDPFVVDYVCHEMGHQLGANHTQNNGCNYNATTGVEPGSGSTIMSYVGICAPNVQASSDDYFHGISLREIADHLETGSGADCATPLGQALTPPAIDALTDRIIPPATPFILSANATADGIARYGWEQFDPEQSIMPPRTTNVEGPLFRSFPPGADNFRSFPPLADALTGDGNSWERLPAISRDMSFGLTVRNISAAYGCWSSEDMTVSVDDRGGAFRVFDPNDGNIFARGQTVQIQWEVAGTDQNPFGCTTVDVLVSEDGGATFTVVAAGEENDGLAVITLPDAVFTGGRIMLRCAESIFYAVTQVNFSTQEPTGTPALAIHSLGSAEIAGCFETSDVAEYTFLTVGSGGVNTALLLRGLNLPPGVSAGFTPELIRPGGRFTMTLSGLTQLPAGVYDIGVLASASGLQSNADVKLRKVIPEESIGPVLQFPADGAERIDLRPTFSLETTGAHTYELQVARDAGFSDVLLQTATNQGIIPTSDYLDGNTRYYWRTRSASGSCGFTEWRTGSFRTGNCEVFRTNSVAQVFGEVGSPAIAEMELTVDLEGEVTDLDLHQLNITHSYVGDLEISLSAPDGTSSLLINRLCGGAEDLFLSLDDDSDVEDYPCPPLAPSLFVVPPNGSLSAFEGTEAVGNWRLTVADKATLDGGVLNAFGLKVCVQQIAFFPVEWLSFAARAGTDEIVLHWETAEETDNRGFTVERRARTDQAEAWKPLGEVAPSGRARGTYQFVDRDVIPGIDYFYRIRQTDFDGSVDYSPLRTARLDGASVPLDVWPNPAGDFLRYRRLTGDTAPLAYEIHDVNGRLQRKGRLSAAGGSLSLAGLPGGVYLLWLENGASIRLIKR